MSEEAFFALTILLWIACTFGASYTGYRRRWLGLILPPLAFAAGFAGLMMLMVRLAGPDAGADLEWLGFAPYFAVLLLLPLPVAFILGRLLAAFRDRKGSPT